MKKFLFLGLGLALLGAPFITKEAHSYSSAVGVDPDATDEGNGEADQFQHDVETKAVKKSATAGQSEALVKGLIVAYSTANDGYTVTRAVTQSHAGMQRLACAVTDSVATGDTAYHRCITKGFARVRYNAGTYAIESGRHACVDAAGVVRGCWLAAAEATANTGIIPLESKTGGDGTDLKVMLQLK